MAQYRYDAVWNSYILEEAQDFHLGEASEHVDPNAGVTGNALDNAITGDAQDNRLDGAGGADTLEGGFGNDAYVVDNPGDVVIEATDGGTGDSVTVYVSYILPEHVENLFLQGYENTTGTGNGLSNTILGSDGGSNLLKGMGGKDRLFGMGGDDTLDGGEGADELWGWYGNDTFIVDDPGDIVTEDENRGEDRVIASVNYTLSANVEHLRLVGLQGLTGIGNGLDNAIIGDSGNDVLEGRDGSDTLDGGAGADTLKGGAGDDLYRIDSTDDVIEELDGGGTDRVETTISLALAAFVENLIASGNANIVLTGNALGNRIQGNGGANTLDGGAGADTLEGGNGDDVYVVDVHDTVTEFEDGGTDWIEAAFDCRLGDHVENLRLSGSQPLAGWGNGLDNRLIGAGGNDTLEGNGGNDTLDGAAGADRLLGGTGDDVYLVDAGDLVEELADQGHDTVIADSSHALAAHVEDLVATGSLSTTLNGNNLDNRLTGNAGANTLSGGAGADTLDGGEGHDVYHVDGLDQVIEAAGSGTDTIVTGASFSLAALAHVENLAATGSGALSLTGNSLSNALTGTSAANTLIGGAGHDVLNGRAGADRMSGGTGNDTYVADNTRDRVVETKGGGRDTVSTSVSFTISSPNHIEVLTATGKSCLSLKGNGLANAITGNTGANKIHGGLGNDVLKGGKGKDTFVFDTKPHAKTNRDMIADFTLKQDRIWLDNQIFKKLGAKGTDKRPAKLNDDFFARDKAKDADDYLIYIRKSGKILYDADGSGRTKAVEFAQVKKGLALTFHDFFVI